MVLWLQLTEACIHGEMGVITPARQFVLRAKEGPLWQCVLLLGSMKLNSEEYGELILSRLHEN